jgi:hypothetical protein
MESQEFGPWVQNSGFSKDEKQQGLSYMTGQHTK